MPFKSDNPIQTVMTSSPHTIAPNQTVHHAKEMMKKYQITHLPVQAESKLVGIVSERDLIFLSSLEEFPDDAMVSDAMIADPYAVLSSTPIKDVAAAMHEKHIGCAIIINDLKKVIGVFTRSCRKAPCFSSVYYP